MTHHLKILYAWIVTDQHGNEGVLRRNLELGTQPMIADSRERLEQFADEARAGAAELKMPLTIAIFIRVVDDGFLQSLSKGFRKEVSTNSAEDPNALLH